jgi:hypothetical protein
MFGMLVMDGHVILKELFYGLPYVITGIVVWRIKSRLSYLVMALAWLSHGFYDYYHDVFFINPGVFSWYPAFCALVDISVGGYLLANFNRVASAALPVDDG